VKEEVVWQDGGTLQDIIETQDPDPDDSWGRWGKKEESDADLVMPNAVDHYGRGPEHVPRVIPPRLPRVREAPAQDQLVPLQPKEVERGMIVVYDTFKRAWVDNCYPDLDEFWLCDETDNKTIFSVTADGQEDSVRAFTASALLFTGQWSPLVEISKDIIITREIQKKLSEMPEWEGMMEEETGVSIMIDKDAIKVVVGPGKPPDVKSATAIAKSRLEKIDQQIWCEEVPEPGSVAETKRSQSAKSEKGKSKVGPVKQESAEQVEPVGLMDVKEEKIRKRPRQADDPEAEEKMAKLEEQFRIGFERGFENALKLAQRRMGEISALTPAPRGAPGDAAGGEATELSLGDVTPLAPNTSKPPKAKPKGKRVVDWCREQDQFAHLPKLQPNWIRVRKSSGDGLYYVNTKTGDTTLIEPREKPKAPPATAAVSSTPVVVGGGITPAALTGATTPGVSGGMTPMVTETPHNPVPSTPMRNPSTPAPVALPEGWAQITSKSTGKPYFWNVKLGISQFHFPSPNQKDDKS